MMNLTQIVAVVDDDESVRRAIKRLLRSFGLEAETFASGEAFLNTLSSATSAVFSCVIADIQMPGIDGLELQRRMVQRGVPVIFVTGNEDAAVREKALAQGAAGYLKKPVDGTILVRAVEVASASRGHPNGSPLSCLTLSQS
ncbi:response regulator transcription factor [Paraburkholderia strydomiana]|uniref:response regulator transcription factor n=1 Tax=Paraburkholderia strydomiana TaxID=1245417 RepID=UPI0038BC8844